MKNSLYKIICRIKRRSNGKLKFSFPRANYIHFVLHGLIQMNQSLEDTYEQHCIAMYERTIAWLFSRGRNFCNSFLHAKVRILSRIPSILGDISLSPSVMNACCLAMPCNFATIFIFLLLRIQLLISDTRLTELLDRVLSVSWNSWSMKFRTSIVDDNQQFFYTKLKKNLILYSRSDVERIFLADSDRF